MRFNKDTSHLATDQRLAAVAAILAEGVLRLRRRAAIIPKEANEENPSESTQNCLEDASTNPLTVHVG